MIEPVSWLTCIGLLLWVIVTAMKWWSKRNDEKNKGKDDIDKEIDNASDADDLMHISGKLRDKR